MSYERSRTRSIMRAFNWGIEKFGLEHIVEPGRRFLDTGCGGGYLMYTLSNAYPEIELYGIDKDHLMAKKSKQLLSSSSIVRADFQYIPFTDEAFDAVVSTSIFDFGCNGMKDFDANRMAWEVNRVLKPGGVYFVHDINFMMDDLKLSKELSIMLYMFDRKNECFFVKKT